MSALALPAPARPSVTLRRPAGEKRLHDLRGEPTLDDVVSGAWEELSARHCVTCPVCGDDMAPQVGSGLPGGGCRGCASHLA